MNTSGESFLLQDSWARSRLAISRLPKGGPMAAEFRLREEEVGCCITSHLTRCCFENDFKQYSLELLCIEGCKPNALGEVVSPPPDKPQTEHVWQLRA
jgi:hypothetical protein